MKTLAGQHTARATETMRQYAGDYTAKAQEYIGSARGRSASPTSTSKPLKSDVAGTSLKSSDFPAAPKEDIKSTPAADPAANNGHAEEEPMIAS